MVPTIQPGSHVIVDRTAYRQGAPQRFDIVVFVPPDDRKSHYAFRVVGLPGEHVQLDATGVSVDGKPVKPPDGLAYVAFTRPEHKTVSDITLGQREYFLLGGTAGSSDPSQGMISCGRSQGSNHPLLITATPTRRTRRRRSGGFWTTATRTEAHQPDGPQGEGTEMPNRFEGSDPTTLQR